METTISGLGCRINIRDPFLLFGVWDCLYLCKKGSFFLPRVMRIRCIFNRGQRGLGFRIEGLG